MVKDRILPAASTISHSLFTSVQKQSHTIRQLSRSTTTSCYSSSQLRTVRQLPRIQTAAVSGSCILFSNYYGQTVQAAARGRDPTNVCMQSGAHQHHSLLVTLRSRRRLEYFGTSVYSGASSGIFQFILCAYTISTSGVVDIAETEQKQRRNAVLAFICLLPSIIPMQS